MKSYHSFLILFIFLISSAFSQIQSNNSIGIQHTPFDLANFVVMLSGDEEAALAFLPGTDLIFTKKKSDDQFFLGSFSYARASSSLEMDYGDRKSTFQIIDIKLGIKFTKGTRQPGNAISSMYVMAGKRFGSTKSEENYDDYDDDENDADWDKYQSQLMSPWMLAGGFGAEYFFNEYLSLNINLHGDLAFVSATYDGDDDERTSKSMMINTRPVLGLNIYY
jgi:hypothetical protein